MQEINRADPNGPTSPPKEPRIIVLGPDGREIAMSQELLAKIDAARREGVLVSPGRDPSAIPPPSYPHRFSSMNFFRPPPSGRPVPSAVRRLLNRAKRSPNAKG
jgi:hypothetical protein